MYSFYIKIYFTFSPIKAIIIFILAIINTIIIVLFNVVYLIFFIGAIIIDYLNLSFLF
jgi:hypothetical protein